MLEKKPSVLDTYKRSLSEDSNNVQVKLFPLSFVPGHQIIRHYGRLSLHFVKEDLNLHAHPVHIHGHHFQMNNPTVLASPAPTPLSLPLRPLSMPTAVSNIFFNANQSDATEIGSRRVSIRPTTVEKPITGVKQDESLPPPPLTINDGTLSVLSNALIEDNEMNRFAQRFIHEIEAVVRAHVVARGGNALIGWRVECSLFRESLKNQAYGLVSVSGDVVWCVPVMDNQLT